MIDPEKARAAFGTGRTWHVDDGDFPGLLARLEQDAIVIDLNDPATENLVADAIRRLAPEGAYVPLSVRYPWRVGRFADLTAPETSIIDVLSEALRGSAAVHEAERIPHLVAPLLALAEAIERGVLVPGPPPGPCPVFSPDVIVTGDGPGDVGFRYPCELLATHAGLHTAEIPPEAIGLPAGRITWPDPAEAAA